VQSAFRCPGAGWKLVTGNWLLETGKPSASSVVGHHFFDHLATEQTLDQGIWIGGDRWGFQ